jgi:hypothetical protein
MTTRVHAWSCAASVIIATAGGCAAVLGIEETTIDSQSDASSPGDSSPGNGDGGGADTGAIDAPNDTFIPKADAGCNINAPFGTVTSLGVTFNSTDKAEVGARFSADELTIYLGRGRDLLRSTRAATTALFPVPSPVTELNVAAPGISGYMTPFPNNLRAIYGSLRSGDTSTEIYEVTRASVMAPWDTPPAKVTAANSPQQDEHPMLRHDGLVLYFDSNRAGNYDIYRADVAVTGKVIAPVVKVDGISSLMADEVNPVVTADELTIYFSRAPGLNVHKATRLKVGDPWGPAAPVTELNSANGERVAWISADGCRVILSSDRSGMGDLFTAEKPKQ